MLPYKSPCRRIYAVYLQKGIGVRHIVRFSKSAYAQKNAEKRKCAAFVSGVLRPDCLWRAQDLFHFMKKKVLAINSAYQPLYQNIYNDIKEKIETGELAEGDRIATEFEIMQQYSVSRITVSRALQELAQHGYIKRFRSKGTFVAGGGDEPADVGSPSTPYSFHSTVALVIPFSSDTIPPLLSSMQQLAQENHLMLSIFNSDRDCQKERKILEQLLETDIAGVISYPIESFENIPLYSQFLFRGIPLLSIDKKLPGLDVPYIKTDSYQAMYNMVQYLIDKGHRRIAYYCHTLNDENENLRFRGYLKALLDNGITPNNAYFVELEKSANAKIMLPENSPVQHGRVSQQLQELMKLEEPPTALACAYDLLAAYVEQQASACGIVVPDQLSITGFDNLQLCNHLQVPLTSAAQDYQKISQTAMQVLLNLRSGKSVEPAYLFPAPIIERQSVKAIRGEESSADRTAAGTPAVTKTATSF